MKIVITGASSFIGTKLVHKVAGQGWDVVSIIRKGNPKKNLLSSISNVEVKECNMCDYSELGTMIGGCDCFVHLAWDGTRGISRLDEIRQKRNYQFGMDAIQSMISAGCGRIITAGSQAEYGICDKEITEETPCNPNTPYGKYKVKLYEDVFELCKNNNVSFKEPRYFSLYGPDDYENSMIMSCIKNMLQNEPCKLTKAIQMWDYLYIDDAIEALLALCCEKCADGAYNLGSGDCRQLKDYIEELKEITNSKSELLYGAIPYTTGMVSIQPSIKKLKNETGWSAKTDFNTGIRKIISQCFEKNSLKNKEE